MLRLENVSFTVETDKSIQILMNVNLDIDINKFIVITGPNGSGKSSLAKIIAGILKPTDGRIYFNDIDITNKTITERAKMGISFSFQQPVRFKGLTVRDLLKLSADNKIGDQEMYDCLEEIGLSAKEYIHRQVDSSLSGGEIKRIEIAMSMLRNSALTIFDEPEAGIDLWSFKNLIRVFKTLKERTNGTIIIISHQERIIEIADEIILLSDGKIVSHGAKKEVYSNILKQ